MMIGPGFFFVSVASRASATGMGLSNCSYMQVIGGLRAGLPLKAVIISLKFCGGFESLSHRREPQPPYREPQPPYREPQLLFIHASDRMTARRPTAEGSHHITKILRWLREPQRPYREPQRPD